jgi:hypothetical protein
LSLEKEGAAMDEANVMRFDYLVDVGMDVPITLTCGGRGEDNEALAPYVVAIDGVVWHEGDNMSHASIIYHLLRKHVKDYVEYTEPSYVVTEDGGKIRFEALFSIMDSEILDGMLDTVSLFESDQHFFNVYCDRHYVVYGENFDPNATKPYKKLSPIVVTDEGESVSLKQMLTIMDCDIVGQIVNVPKLRHHFKDGQEFFNDYQVMHHELYGSDFSPNAEEPYSKVGMQEGRVVDSEGRYIQYGEAVSAMDDELREQLHVELAPTTPQRFFNEYSRRHEEKFGEEWTDYL